MNFLKTHRYWVLAFYYVAFIIAFFILEANTPTEGLWITDLPFDEKIPFIPQFVYFYVLWYPLFAAVGLPLLILDGPAFKRWMYYMMITLSLTLIFDAIVPNGHTQRVEGMEVTGLSTWLLSRLWVADTPTNVFPSMHVLGCIGDIVGVFDSKRFGKWRWVIVALAVLCMASTMLVKQHAYIDAVGAVAFAIPVFFAVYGRRFFGKEARQRRRGGDTLPEA